jgi:hypothetical protein
VCQSLDGWHWDLKLCKDKTRILDQRTVSVQIGCLQFSIGAGYHNDDVFSVVAGKDYCHARGAGSGFDCGGANSGDFESMT